MWTIVNDKGYGKLEITSPAIQFPSRVAIQEYEFLFYWIFWFFN